MTSCCYKYRPDIVYQKSKMKLRQEALTQKLSRSLQVKILSKIKIKKIKNQ